MERIFILSSHPLFGQGIKTLLEEQAEVQVVGREADPVRAIDAILDLKPDVVILDNDESRHSGTLLLALIFQELVDIRVVRLSLANNQILIYQGERRVIEGPGDLLKAIRCVPSIEEKH